MDLVEWMFGKFVKQRQNVRKTLEESSVAYAEDEIASLQILMGFVLTDEPLPIAFGAGIGRAGRTTLHLPESIGLSSDQELNRELYLHKILSASMIHRERFAYSAVGLSYAERTLEILAASDRVVARLNEQFPKFGEFHRSLTARLSNIRKAPISKESAEDREAEALLNGGHTGKYFRWQRFPERTLAPWVELMSPSDLSADRISVSVENQEDPKVLKEKKAPETELLGKSSTESPEEVSLEKKKKEQSPVFHSFEKLETADEYGGGSRVTDADDDLEDHFDALEELNLRHVTREGGEAGSIYKAQFSELMGFHLGRAGTPRYPHYKFTDEWDYKRKGFLPEHCRLYLLDANAHQRENSVVDFKQNLKKIYSAELEVWRHKITALVNQRAWRDRQVDGEEWNIDATTRYLADMKSCGFGDNRLFSRRVRRHRDFRVTILMDLSLSSDSWVMNKRVLDIQLDSVGLCGLLLEQMSEPISVLGTWSETRHHCYLDTIKKFDSSWDEFFKIGSEIAPRGYTRLGPAIRHAVSEFQSVKSKNRLLILLTDGKPTDLDHYEGHYGIEDMRHAMMEAEQAGVHVHALAVDQEAKSYFPQLFNPNRYQILSDPRKLPEQLFKIYFGFTRGK